MGRITIRETSAELPAFDEEADLERVSSLGPAGALVSHFEFGATMVRALDVKDVRLLGGKIRSVRSERAGLTRLRADSVEFSGCELGSLRWAGGKITRTRFDSCKLLGARLEDLTLEHVVFTDCKMDYAILDRIRAAGPVLFVRCSLREAEFTGCDLNGALFDGCDLSLATFGPGKYRGCDLRGNDLSAVVSTHHLERIVIDRPQLIQLAQALAAELGVTFGDDPGGPVPGG